MNSLRILLLMLLSPLLIAAGPASSIDFNRDIQPILTAQCIECHGPKKAKGSLRLDAKSLAFEGGLSGKSILPGNSEKSPFIRRIRGLDDEDQMPLKKPPLPPDQVALLAAWIDQGANWPDSPAAEIKVAKHWSFIKPARPAIPQIRNPKSTIRNPIDAFILSRLEKENLPPSPQAPKETLLRRVHLDLIGLPPSPKEIADFLADTSPDAYENVVDRLLASSHYGERQARHWLDLARYADSNGYSIDSPRSIWKYRDWVINAFNQNKPFDQFLIEQLAGDLLPNATIDQRIATGFHRNTQINEEGGIDPEQFRIESVFDRVATTGTVFLGLTIGCAQCHNHKFDPISQRDYYQLFAFFNNQDEPKLNVSPAADEQASRSIKQEIARLESELKHYDEPEFLSRQPEWESKLTDDAKRKLKADVRSALRIAPDQRDEKQRDAVLAAYKASDPDHPAKTKQLAALKKQLTDGVTTLVLEERKDPRPTHLFIKGDFTRPGDPVTPGTPAILHALSQSTESSNRPNRLHLATWLTSPENPLTARVTVNRYWQQFFGKGLVETENDFGTQGALPTHPDLLDYLATEFQQSGWNIKHLHRLIVTSATYRQSSAEGSGFRVQGSATANLNPEPRTPNPSSDPYNKLLARQNRLRLDAEIVRDVALSASGLLSPKIGGPSVFPPQPDGVLSLGQVRRTWTPSPGPDRYRRGMYTFFYRATPHPLLNTFDAADGVTTCTRRLRSNTPLQSLTLLNDDAFVEFAKSLAQRLLRSEASSDDARLTLAFQLCTARAPSADELTTLKKVLHTQRDNFASSPAEARALAGDSPSAPELASWTILSRILLNLDETITRE